MINVESFWASPIDNVIALNNWRAERQLRPIEATDLATTGLMIFDDHKRIAAGFLRDAEGLGIIDSVASNSEMPKELRQEALDVLFQHLLAIAKTNNMTGVIGTSSIESMIERAKKFGFQKTSDAVMVLSLRGK